MTQLSYSRAIVMPADIDREDPLFGPLSGRQLVIVGAAALGLWLLFHVGLPLLVFAVIAVPVAAAAVALALGRRDGVSLDRYLWAALRHLATTRRHPAGPDTPAAAFTAAAEEAGRGGWWAAPRRPTTRPAPPALDVAQAPRLAVVDLGRGGLAVLAVASSVAWGLRSPGEQDAMVAVFARWLHSLSAPTQVLVRAMPLDLAPNITALTDAAPGLPHPALGDAATDHAAYLGELAAGHDLLCRQIVLIFREPDPAGPPAGNEQAQARRDRAALARLGRRLAEAGELLAPAGITVTPVNADQAASILDTTTNPYPPHHPPDPAPAPGAQPAPDPAAPVEPPAGPVVARLARPPGAGGGLVERGWYPLPLGRWSQ